MQHANLVALHATKTSHARTTTQFVDHPPTSRRLPLDNRRRWDFYSGAMSCYDSLDIGEDKHVLVVAVQRLEPLHSPCAKQSHADRKIQDDFLASVDAGATVSSKTPTW